MTAPNRPAIMTYAEAAQIMTANGTPMSPAYAQCCEDRALKKLRKALAGMEVYEPFAGEGFRIHCDVVEHGGDE